MNLKYRILVLYIIVAFLSNCTSKLIPNSAYTDFYEGKIKHYNQSFKPTHSEEFRIRKPSDKVWNIAIEVIMQDFNILNIFQDEKYGKCLKYVGLSDRKYKQRDILEDSWMFICVRSEKDKYSVLQFGSIETISSKKRKIPLDRMSILHSVQYSVKQKLCDYNDTWLQKLHTTSKTKILEKHDTTKNIEYQEKYLENFNEKAVHYGNYLSAINRLNGAYTVLEFPEVEKRIQKIVRRLNESIGIKKDIKIWIVADNTKLARNGQGNAGAYANGDIFITTELLHEVKNEDELAGIIAHELAHIYENDFVFRRGSIKRGIIQSRVISAPMTALYVTIMPVVVIAASLTVSDGLQNGFLQSVGTGAVLTGIAGLYIYYLAVNPSLSKYVDLTTEQEINADLVGTEYLWEAGYDYKALVSLFNRRIIDTLGVSKLPQDINSKEVGNDFCYR